MKNYEVCVRGAGVVGQSLALSLAHQGLQVALMHDAAGVAREDVRAYALNAASVDLLRSLKVWDQLDPHAATAVYDMRIEGDSNGGLLEFSAWQQHVAELAWITDAQALEHSLASAVRHAPRVDVVAEADAINAPLLALCEGKASDTREALGVAWHCQRYGHSALAARLTTSQTHQNTAHQWFKRPDVLALLPFDSPQPGHSYALVWSLPDEHARELLAASPAEFEQALAEATRGACGELKLASERASWPLMLAHAEAWCGPGWVLLGDAAHVIHPLAGQGLNLGLADVATLSRVVAEREAWRPLGDAKLLRRYERERRAPVAAMGQLTDGLLKLFANEQPALRELRNRGMGLVNHLSPLKRWLTSRALGS